MAEFDFGTTDKGGRMEYDTRQLHLGRDGVIVLRYLAVQMRELLGVQDTGVGAVLLGCANCIHDTIMRIKDMEGEIDLGTAVQIRELTHDIDNAGKSLVGAFDQGDDRTS